MKNIYISQAISIGVIYVDDGENTTFYKHAKLTPATGGLKISKFTIVESKIKVLEIW